MLKLKKELTCSLLDEKTGKELLTFYAQQVGNPLISAGFEAGAVASASQSMTIETETPFDYKPLQHNVLVGGVQYILTSFSPAVRRRHGAGWGNRPRTLYILNLE